MEDLRWVLLGLGVLVVLGVYWISRPRPPKPEKSTEETRLEPVVSPLETPASAQDTEAEELEADADSESPQVTERVIAIRLVAPSDPIGSEGAILALREAGLLHGRFGIFHRRLEGRNASVFSVASLVEPGSFDLTKAKESKLPGMTLFMVLPNAVDPVTAFDDMVATARVLSQQLDLDLVDEQGSSWSIQRERYLREEIIQFRHQQQGAA